MDMSLHLEGVEELVEVLGEGLEDGGQRLQIKVHLFSRVPIEEHE